MQCELENKVAGILRCVAHRGMSVEAAKKEIVTEVGLLLASVIEALTVSLPHAQNVTTTALVPTTKDGIH